MVESLVLLVRLADDQNGRRPAKGQWNFTFGWDSWRKGDR